MTFGSVDDQADGFAVLEINQPAVERIEDDGGQQRRALVAVREGRDCARASASARQPSANSPTSTPGSFLRSDIATANPSTFPGTVGAP
jgi:hypothetical protein